MKTPQALSDYVIIRPSGSETATPGGIVLPAQNNDKKSAIRGEVISCGPGRLGDLGEPIPMPVKVGDQVLFDNSRSQPFSFDHQLLQLVRAEFIFANVPKDD